MLNLNDYFMFKMQSTDKNGLCRFVPRCRSQLLDCNVLLQDMALGLGQYPIPPLSAQTYVTMLLHGNA